MSKYQDPSANTGAGPKPTSFLHLIEDDGSIAPPVRVARYLAQSLGADASTLPDDAQADDANMSLTARRGVPSIPLLKERGCDYRVVGVFGGQSSGKSTLLNQLFATRFDTMNEDQGRTQTTKGCFLSKARCDAANADPHGEGLFVMDFEGTDGVERGEDQSFERQLSLFALSVADTLIINMWANEVGRFNAANLSLLQTVFEVNLQLNAHEADNDGGSRHATPADAKPTLLFVLRDFTAGTLDKAEEVITTGLHKIWERISKPEQFAESKLEDLFLLRFCSLPHYVLQRNEFDKAVNELRQWFLNPKNGNYLYKHIKRGNFRAIPLDGVAQYLESCWQSICSQRDLDIPTQREMLARLRCAELADALIAEHEVDVQKRCTRIAEGRLVPNITGWVRAVTKHRLQLFERDTKHYAPRVVEEQLEHLRKMLDKISEQAIAAQCKKIADALVRTCDAKVQHVMHMAMQSVLPRLAAEWYQKIDDARQAAVKACKGEGASTTAAIEEARRAQSKVTVGPTVLKFWQFVSQEITDVTAALRESLDNASPAAGAGAGSKSDEGDTPTSATKSSSGVSRDFELRSPDASHSEEDARTTLLSCLTNDPEATERTMAQLAVGMQHRVTQQIEAITAGPASAMSNTFDRVLGQNPDGTTRYLSTVTGLDKCFGPSRAAGLLLLACVTVNRLSMAEAAIGAFGEDTEEQTKRRLVAKMVEQWQKEAMFLEFGIETNPKVLIGAPTYPTLPNAGRDETRAAARAAFEQLVLLSASSVDQAYLLYNQHCQFKHEMLLKQIEAGQGSIPAWVVIMLLLLGANEIWWLLTNPHMLLFGCVVAWFFFSNWITAQWQRFEESGPAGIVLPAKAGLQMIHRVYTQHVQPLIGGGRGPRPAAAVEGDARRAKKEQ
jgi:hypothetical protein